MGQLLFGVYDAENADRLVAHNNQYRTQLKEAEASGDEAWIKEMRGKMLWPAHSLKSMKESLGLEFLIESGFNLSEAERYYGKDWINE